jgi:hypothetical protein
MKKHILILSALILSFAQPVFADLPSIGEKDGIRDFPAASTSCTRQSKSVASGNSSDVNATVSTSGNGNG